MKKSKQVKSSNLFWKRIILSVIVITVGVFLTILFAPDNDSSVEKNQTPAEKNIIATNIEITDDVVQPAEQFFVDWNKDGIKDLVRKELDGKYYVFPNQGTDESPVYNESYSYNESK